MDKKRTTSSFRAMSTERKLESIFLFVTGRCNAKCAMCFYAQEMDKKQPDLTFDEIKKISETAGQFNRLWISGGEPTLREDLPEILELFYKNNHIKDVNIPTNGLKPDRIVEWVKRFRQNCPDCNINVSLSLDGFGTTHDTQRGVPGNFYKALETLRKIQENFGDDGKVLKNIATVITKYNIDQVDISPIYSAYADRMVADTTGLRKPITRFFYLGLIRTLYNVRASNIDHPTPWGMDCTAGETTLVIDYDGRFRACELRKPLGNIKEYGCDISKVMNSEAIKQEIAAIGHGYKANCWCTHGCWITSSVIFNPRKMIRSVYKGYRETKRLNHPLAINEQKLQTMEAKYHLDIERLRQLNIR